VKSLSEITGARSICSPSRSLNVPEWSALDIMQPRRPQVSDYLALVPEPDLDLQVKEKLIYNVFASEK
jgi:hypothetical protein